MSRIVLFYMVLGDRQHGGGAFTTNLIRGLRAHGHDVMLVRVKKRDAAPTVFGDGERIYTASLASACELARMFPSIVAVAHHQDCAEELTALVELGVPWICHGQANIPTREEFPALVGALKRREGAINIRQSLCDLMRQRIGITTPVIPHPYMRVHPEKRERTVPGVNVTRITFAKHIELVVHANRLLEDPIRIYGTLDRMYVHHKLRVAAPDWEKFYVRPAQLGEATSLLSEARTAIDMSYWKDDAGGTQYTFFEAWDAETPLILHKKWFDAREPTSRAATFVSTAEELADAVRAADTSHVEAGLEMLERHDAKKIAGEYLSLLREKGRTL